MLTSLVPLVLYIITMQFGIDFTLILSIGGVISGGLTGIIILIMAKKAKGVTRNNKDPEIQVPINWIIMAILFIIFMSAIIIQIANYI